MALPKATRTGKCLEHFGGTYRKRRFRRSNDVRLSGYNNSVVGLNIGMHCATCVGTGAAVPLPPSTLYVCPARNVTGGGGCNPIEPFFYNTVEHRNVHTKDILKKCHEQRYSAQTSVRRCQIQYLYIIIVYCNDVTN